MHDGPMVGAVDPDWGSLNCVCTPIVRIAIDGYLFVNSFLGQYVVLVVFRSVTFVFLILHFNIFLFFMEDFPENHVFT